MRKLINQIDVICIHKQFFFIILNNLHISAHMQAHSFKQ